MKIGLFAINFGTCGDPQNAVKVAQAAEAAGFDSVWTGEHIVLPIPMLPSFPLATETPLLDTTVALTDPRSGFLVCSFNRPTSTTLRLGATLSVLFPKICF